MLIDTSLSKDTPLWAKFLQKRDATAIGQQRKVKKTVANAALWQTVERIRAKKPADGFTKEQIMAFGTLFLPIPQPIFCLKWAAISKSEN